jgi:hypothetical protein
MRPQTSGRSGLLGLVPDPGKPDDLAGAGEVRERLERALQQLSYQKLLIWRSISRISNTSVPPPRFSLKVTLRKR